MKKKIYNIRELTDSVEIYGKRGNIISTLFIYVVLFISVLLGIYIIFGELNITSTAYGIVRPNENISTISSLRDGVVVEINYLNGQQVKAGDSLLSLDVSDLDIRRIALEDKTDELRKKINMNNRFIGGINANKNPFSENQDSKEYSYYLKFRDYELQLQNTTGTFIFDESKTKANFDSTNDKIQDLYIQINGLNAYRESVKNGENLVSKYPDYERLYKLYINTINSLEIDYVSQKTQFDKERLADNTELLLKNAIDEAQDYTILIDSIIAETSLFNESTEGNGKLLYDIYLSNLNEYKLAYEKAKDTYDYFNSGGAVSNKENEVLMYDNMMLSGYKILRDSIEDDTNYFQLDEVTSSYMNLYLEYKNKHDIYLSEDINKANEFKQSMLVDVGMKIIEIQSLISQKEISLDIHSNDYRREVAEKDMISAKEAIDSYRSKSLAEFKENLKHLQMKISELNSRAIMNSNELEMTSLFNKFNAAQEKHYLSTLADVDAKIQSVEDQLLSLNSSQRMNSIAINLLELKKDENGNPIPISVFTLETLSSLMHEKELIENELNEINVELSHIYDQIDKSCIKAGQDGVINIISNVATGDVVPAGTPIATIIPHNENTLKVDLYISNHDLGRIKLNDAVNYNIAAFPKQQYGSASGRILSISSDAIINNGEFSGFFLATGSIDDLIMSDNRGKSGEITVGMELEAKIIIDKKTILQYLLEKIDIF